MNSQQRRFARRHHLVNRFEANRRLDMAFGRTLQWIERYDALYAAKVKFQNFVLVLLDIAMVAAWWNFSR